MSATGSVSMPSPARLHEARNLPLARETAQAEAAHPEPTIEGARSPAERAAVVRPYLELGRPGGLRHETGLCHMVSYARNGTPRARSSALPSASLRADVQIVTVRPLILSTLSR